MDWSLFAKVFFSVALAEVADKTQLVTVSYAAAESRPLTVFLASALALAASAALAVLVGGTAGHFLQGPWLKRVVGGVFIVIGVLYLAGRA
jgi:putative Ca2+/H+ antiporter (TMEM165/GDT1 family)